MTQNEKWIGVREAAELTGLSQSNFLYYVDKGEIGVQPDSKPRLYSLADVRNLARRMAKKKKRAPREEVIIDWLRVPDVPAGLKLDYLVYQEHVDLAELAVYQSWRKNNDRLTMAALTPDRAECLGYIQLTPLPERIILDVLAGRRSESSISADEVLSYEQPGGYTLLAMSAVAHPDHPDLLYQVLRKYMEFWVEQYPERYILRVYAQVVSEAGDRMVQHFFMSPRLDLSENAYMLDLSRPSASKMVRAFQARLREKAPLPEELQRSYATPASPTPSPVLPAAAPRPTPAPKTVRPASTTTEKYLRVEQPEGTISLADLAAEIGIHRRTLLDQALKGTFAHIALPIPGRDTYARYFSAEQAQVVRDWYAKKRSAD